LSLPAVLIDERAGRVAAEKCGIAAIGTLNILDSADRLGLLRLEDAVTKLRQTNFHIDSAIIDALVVLARARKSGA
jgi:predicted nucleic acid-binding protein